jgi:raffinose/stachyose/melibiose transport system permease protein
VTAADATRAPPALGIGRSARRTLRPAPRSRPWVFVVPALAISLSVCLLPSIATILMAFTDWDGAGWPRFVGLANYAELAGSPAFWSALGNNLLYTLCFTTLPMGFGLFVALMLTTVRRGRVLFQAIYFLPATIATVILARVWQGSIFSPVTGVVAWLQGLGVPVNDPLASTTFSLPGVITVDMWHWWGFLAVVFFAALRQVDPDLVDAASIDGANRRQVFRHVLIPSILPTIVFMVLMTIIWSFLSFDWVWVMTNGGPGFSSEVLATLAYKDAFQRSAVGQAAAASVVMSLVGLCAITLYLRAQRTSGAA